MKGSNVVFLVVVIILAGNLYCTYLLEKKIKERRVVDYPVGAKNIKDLGNGWTSFHFKIGNKNRLFLRHVFTDTGSESLTEIDNAEGVQ